MFNISVKFEVSQRRRATSILGQPHSSCDKTITKALAIKQLKVIQRVKLGNTSTLKKLKWNS